MAEKGMFINARFTEPGHVPPQPTEIDEYDYRMRIAKRNGNMMAYMDSKRHYEKLIRKEKHAALMKRHSGDKPDEERKDCMETENKEIQR